MNRMPLTLFGQHVAKWNGCQACELGATRNKMVFCRGQVPCDILFVGEAPGESENVIGQPFVGPAGQLLNRIIDQGIGSFLSFQRWQEVGTKTFRPSWAFTNLVCCIPRNAVNGGKTAEPDDRCIEACKPRLVEFITLAAPKLIVGVGKLAKDWLEQGYKYSVKLPNPNVKQVSITHPAAILRASVAMRGLMTRKCVVTLQNAIEEL